MLPYLLLMLFLRLENNNNDIGCYGFVQQKGFVAIISTRQQQQQQRRQHPMVIMMNATSSSNNGIAYQSDSTQYGRGEFHLSADISEGDVVVYQTGTWYVDGVEVGDGNSAADWKLARIETIQVVWTHNCEHGVLRGYPVKLILSKEDEDDGYNTILSYDSNNDDVDDYSGDPGESVEFGPEQLVARLPVTWDDTIGKVFSNIKLDPSMWRQE